MCGLGHGLMAGRIIVETPQEHAAWLLHNSNPEAADQLAAPVPAVESSTMAEVRR
jgi:heme/copper-type cytochrome/quinol oxidase subunit 2